MDGELSGVGGEQPGQLQHLVLGLLGGVGVGEEVDHIQRHSTLGNHVRGHRGVDAPGQQRRRTAVDAHRQASGPRLRAGVDIGGIVPDLQKDGKLRVVDVHGQIGIALVQLASHILTELDGGHRKGLIRPLRLYLEGPGGAELVPQKLLGGGQDRVLVLLAGPGQRQAHDAEYFFQGLVGPRHVAGILHRLHIGGGLAGVDPELAEGVEAAVQIGLQFVLEAAAVEAFEDQLSQLEQNNFVHCVSSFRRAENPWNDLIIVNRRAMCKKNHRNNLCRTVYTRS